MKPFQTCHVLASLVILTGVATAEPNRAAERMSVERLRAYFPHADGRGIRVGVVADSVAATPGLAEDQALGDLPGNDRLLILNDGPASSRDEGRAMLHHIHDVAPGLNALGFATATGGQQSMASAIATLSSTHGMDIIVDAYSYPDEPVYQEGVVALAINDHTSRGIHVSAAGNLGDASVEQVWRDADGDDYHEFDVHGAPDEFLPFNGVLGTELTLFWSERWGGAARDFNIELYDDKWDLIATSPADSTVTRLPFDSLSHPTANSGLFVRVKATQGGPSGVRFKLLPVARELTRLGNPFVLPNRPFTGSGAITPHAGTRSIAVGSSGFLSTSVAAGYSSRGLYRLLFASDGTPGDQIYQKPDFIAADSAPVPVGSFGAGAGFDNTAAAAANVAGVSALVLQLAGGPDSMNQAQLRQHLRLTSRVNPPLSHSREVGFGFIDALGAGLAAAGPQPLTQMVIPNHLGDVNAPIEAVGANQLNVLRFPRAGSDFVTVRVASRWASVQETSDLPAPMHLVFDESAAPLKALSYTTPETNFEEQTTRFVSTTTTQPTTPLAQVVVASELAFATNQLLQLEIDGPAFLYQTPATNEWGGALFPGEPIAYFEVRLPADGGPGFTVEVSSQDVDVVLAAFSGLGAELGRSTGPVLTARVPENDEGFYLAVAGRNYDSFGNFDVRLSYQRVPGIPRGGVEFPAVSTEAIPNPVTGRVPLFGRLGPDLDRDVWAVRTGGGSLAASVLSAAPSTANLSLGAYNDGQLLVVADGPALLPTVSIPTQAGRLYLVVGAHGEGEPATDFSGELVVRPPAAQPHVLLPDRERGEYFRGLQNGSLRGIGDVVNYRFIAPPIGTGQVYIGADNREFVNPAFNVAFQLFDAAGAPIEGLVDAQSALGDESFTYELTPGAEYFVQVFGSPTRDSYVGDTIGFGDYRLDVRAYTTRIVAEPDEPNNLIDAALDLTELPGEWSEGKFTPFILTDVDFFRIRLSNPDNAVEIRIRFAGGDKAPAPTAPAFVLRNRDGAAIGQSEDVAGEQVLLIPRGLAPEDYFIEVPGDNSGTPYGIWWQGAPAAPLPEGWVLE